MGKKGEYVIRLTKDIDTCMTAPVAEVLLPQDFRSHIDIYNKLPLTTITAGGPLEFSTPTDPVSTAEFLEENVSHLRHRHLHLNEEMNHQNLLETSPMRRSQTL